MARVTSSHRPLAAALAWLILLGCGPDGAPIPKAHHATPSSHEPAAVPKVVDPSTPALCSRPGDDEVRDIFCAGAPPTITGLSALEKAVHIDFTPADSYGQGSSPFAGYEGSNYQRAVVLAHSTALSGALVSPLNPRVIVIGSMTFVAFNRGVQQAELASLDRQAGKMNMYLVSFEQACNALPPGCTPGDLFTPNVESDWTSVTIKDDEDLKNTPFDCRQCHERNEDEPVLLMRELDGPWTHFFAPQQGDALYPDPADTSYFPEPSGGDLLGDYLSAKGDEAYAGVPTGVLRATIGFTLENLVNSPQPLVFDGSTIMNERWPWTQADGYQTTPVRSATWDASYEAFKRGEQLAMPFYAPRVSDPQKLTTLTDAYQRYRSGELDAASLPDLADIFPDDAQTRAEIGLQSEPGATPAQALVQACGTCHNDVLDQSISRARFNIAVSRLSRAELNEAIARLSLPRGSAGSMPPPGRRELDPDTVRPLVEYLKGETRPDGDDAFLEHAATVGMAPKRMF